MMMNAVWLAGIFGPYLAIMGLWMLLYSDNFSKVMTSIKNTISVLYVTGMINLLIGLTILSEYRSWDWNLAILLTIYGWLMVIRGVLVFFAPHACIKCMTSHKMMKSMGIVPFVVGLALCWLAFMS